MKIFSTDFSTFFESIGSESSRIPPDSRQIITPIWRACRYTGRKVLPGSGYPVSGKDFASGSCEAIKIFTKMIANVYTM